MCSRTPEDIRLDVKPRNILVRTPSLSTVLWSSPTGSSLRRQASCSREQKRMTSPFNTGSRLVNFSLRPRCKAGAHESNLHAGNTYLKCGDPPYDSLRLQRAQKLLPGSQCAALIPAVHPECIHAQSPSPVLCLHSLALLERAPGQPAASGVE